VRVELPPEERRVLGVLIEKGLTAPEAGPLSLNALVAGCNQKSNRDPVVQYDDVRVEAVLDALTRKGLVVSATAMSGRVDRWRQNLGTLHELRGVELAVIAELLLRGPQTEGELRARASRMRPIPDLPALHEILARLRSTTPPFVVRLSADGAVRGVRVTHALYPEDEAQSVVRAESAAEPPLPQAVAVAESALRDRVEALERRVAELERILAGRAVPDA
jgi:uncharacterized protein